jgi:hypothetical protein
LDLRSNFRAHQALPVENTNHILTNINTTISPYGV